MKSFLKTYLVILAILSGIVGFVGLLFWGAFQLFGTNGLIIATIVLAIMVLSFGVTAAIENSR